MTKRTIIKNNPEKNVQKKCVQEQFSQNIFCMNAIAYVPHDHSKIDLQNATEEAYIGLKALKPNGAIQEMLAAQMLSIHKLQQNAVSITLRSHHPEMIQYYTNAAIKLANCFTQQANMLSKLQGYGQKITVEHVEVHNGGQAVVGAVIEK